MRLGDRMGPGFSECGGEGLQEGDSPATPGPAELGRRPGKIGAGLGGPEPDRPQDGTGGDWQGWELPRKATK